LESKNCTIQIFRRKYSRSETPRAWHDGIMFGCSDDFGNAVQRMAVSRKAH
jgi:hypothetical protein